MIDGITRWSGSFDTPANHHKITVVENNRRIAITCDTETMQDNPDHVIKMIKDLVEFINSEWR